MTSEDTRNGDATSQAARGALLITLAKVWFMATGFLQPVLLARALGGEGYGLYGLALSTMSIVNNVVVSGSIQSMSRSVIESGPTSLRRGLVLHAAIGAALGGALALFAEPLGVGVLHNSRLPALLRVGAIVVADYSIYAALVGAINGRRRYDLQAALDITFSTLRTALVVGLAMKGFGALGSVAGFAAASAIIVVIALALSQSTLLAAATPAAARESFGAFALKYGRYFAPVLVYQLALNLVLQVDGLLFSAIASRRGLGEGEVTTLIGIYKVVQSFAFLPYQLLIAVTFVVFPVVSRSTLDGDRDATRHFIAGAMRFSAIALGAMVSVLAGVPRGVLQLAFKPPFDDGANALRYLAVGQGAFTLLVLGTTIVIAAARTRAASGLMLFTLAGVVVGDALGVTLSRSGIDALEGLAIGTASGWIVGASAVGWYVRRHFGAFVSLSTAARVALSASAAAIVGASLPLAGKPGTLLSAGVCVLVYLVVLAAFGEVSRDEVVRGLRVIRRKKA